MIDANPPVDIKKTILERTPILDALRAGVREAAKRHQQAGRPMVIFRNGEIVRISAEEFLRELDAHEAQTAKELAAKQPEDSKPNDASTRRGSDVKQAPPEIH